jgi:hypothetical protein
VNVTKNPNAELYVGDISPIGEDLVQSAVGMPKQNIAEVPIPIVDNFKDGFPLESDVDEPSEDDHVVR